jgi:hypothetical protein
MKRFKGAASYINLGTSALCTRVHYVVWLRSPVAGYTLWSVCTFGGTVNGEYFKWLFYRSVLFIGSSVTLLSTSIFQQMECRVPSGCVAGCNKSGRITSTECHVVLKP